MILLTDTITPRIQYIADFTATVIGREPFQVTTDPETFLGYNGIKINYTSSRLTLDELWIIPHTILFETRVRKFSIDMFDYKGHKAFFKTGGDFPFDIFAASFYLLTRYEEYLPFNPDKYGRFDHETSLAFREGFLGKPLVNTWMNDLESEIQKKFSISPKHINTFQFLPTYDIDEAYSYRHKSLPRTIGAIAKSIIKGQVGQVMERAKSWNGGHPDPFDSYDWMDSLHDRFNLHPYYFFLIAKETGRYDRNILPDQPAFRQLVKRHAQRYKVGIHPSWQSGDDASKVKNEINMLEKISGQTISASRQHFIRFTLPETFRILLNNGIEKDFSMGYGAINGFRASVTTPFFWYDLERDRRTGLQLFPFCFMEANSFYEQKDTPTGALEEMRNLYREIRTVNGTMITIWHNTFLGTGSMFAGWREIYLRFVEEIL